jgi:hypothetical protein
VAAATASSAAPPPSAASAVVGSLALPAMMCPPRWFGHCAIAVDFLDDSLGTWFVIQAIAIDLGQCIVLLGTLFARIALA